MRLALASFLLLAGCARVSPDAREPRCHIDSDCGPAERCNRAAGSCEDKPSAARGAHCDALPCDPKDPELVCIPADHDPSGLPTCRARCPEGTCSVADETCTMVPSGDRLCTAPLGDLDALCDDDRSCAAQRRCVRPDPAIASGARCRTGCDLARAPHCEAGRICAAVMGGGAACIPDPCAINDCMGLACRRTGASSSDCTDAGFSTGVFSALIDTATTGSARGTASAPGLGSFNLNAGAEARTSTSATLVVSLIAGMVPTGTLELQLGLPIARVERGVEYAIGWDVIGRVVIVSPSGDVEVEAEAITGTMRFTASGTIGGARVVGMFDARLAGPR